MKIFMMLLLSLSMFFVVSCGSDSNDDGTKITEDDGTKITEKEFYLKTAIQSCEMAFQCDVDVMKQGKTTKEECTSVETELVCTTDFTKFDASAAAECIECGGKLTCDKFFDANGLPTAQSNCPACAKTCVPK